MRRALTWLVVVLAVAAGTGALLWFTTASAARFDLDGDRLTVSGQLTLASNERLNVILEENGDLSTLVIGDVAPVGGVTLLLQKGMVVRAAGLSTELAPGVTLTGDAAYLLLSGITRSVGADATVAVTGWQTPAGPAATLPRDHPAHSERLDYVRRMLGAEDFYWFTLEAGSDAPHAMTPAELSGMDVVTE